jgi:hypothetical protein
VTKKLLICGHKFSLLKIRFLLVGFLFFTCGSPVEDFDGFTKNQVEFLLSGEEGKGWELISRFVDGDESALSECEEQTQYIFQPDASNDIKPLLLTRSSDTCDSLEFCLEFPQYCVADTFNCNLNPSYCRNFNNDTLFIGYWEVKSQELSTARTDTVFLYLWDEFRTMDIEFLTSQIANFKYEDVSSSSTIIQEDFVHLMPDTE